MIFIAADGLTHTSNIYNDIRSFSSLKVSQTGNSIVTTGTSSTNNVVCVFNYSSLSNGNCYEIGSAITLSLQILAGQFSTLSLFISMFDAGVT